MFKFLKKEKKKKISAFAKAGPQLLLLAIMNYQVKGRRKTPNATH